FVSQPTKAFASHLRRRKGKHIWMMGGAGIIASFLDQGEIDEFMTHVIPNFIGEGIPLIAPARRTVPLKLISCTKFTVPSGNNLHAWLVAERRCPDLRRHISFTHSQLAPQPSDHQPNFVVTD